jgi:hypothetical protein
MDKTERQAIQERADKLQAELDCLKELLKEKEHRFYKGQPVLVRMGDACGWDKKYLASRQHGLYNCYCEGKTARTTKNITSWPQCKPDPSAPSLLNWIEWEGGECPVDGDKLVVSLWRNGEIEAEVARNLVWRHDAPEPGDMDSDIIRYAVIEKPEFI